MLLCIERATVHYQQVMALRGISIDVGSGRIVTIIGANGAGKTTSLRAISGLVPLSGGEIRLDGERIDGEAPDRIVARGIGHVPEGRRCFPDLTVLENLHTGAYLRRDPDGVATDLDEVFTRFPRLKERRRQLAKTLSGGEQQMLAIGRALMARPKILLLDEPSMGLAPKLVREIATTVVEINRDHGVTVVLVEQNAALALEIASYAYVLETGTVALAGPAAELRGHAHVQRAYLGL
jgi:branched-chain amino acid transport system ATP-binding protein